MNNQEFIVITSISHPNKALSLFADGANRQRIGLIVIGDTKSPADFYLENCEFYSIERQLKSNLKFAELCPTRHYARKNIGYLLAIAKGAKIIRDTDDDNLPRAEFWDMRTRRRKIATYCEGGWANIYRWFSKSSIWPRGLPLDQIRNLLPDYQSLPIENVDSPIQQGLADENPDVDAVYRLLLSLPENFLPNREVALGSFTWCPFNSQNTTWFQDAFPLLYLPAHCSFRMTDIWRSFVAQRIAWENDWKILFHSSTVWQERNEHNLMQDFEDEISGYLHNSEIANVLSELSLSPGLDALSENLLICYESLCRRGWIIPKEIQLLETWLSDLKAVS